MATTRPSKLCDSRSAAVALAVLALAGCPARPPLITAVDVPPAPRHPDGVLIEPSPAIPPVEDSARARGVVALREPLADEAIKYVVRQYVRAWTTESLDGLEQLLTADAVSLDAAHQTRAQLRDAWRTRMQNLDFKKLAGAEVARLDHIERYDYADLGIPGAPARPSEMHPGDVLARVPIATPRVGAEQLFPDVVVLLLRRDEGRYRVAGIGEAGGP